MKKILTSPNANAFTMTIFLVPQAAQTLNLLVTDSDAVWLVFLALNFDLVLTFWFFRHSDNGCQSFERNRRLVALLRSS